MEAINKPKHSPLTPEQRQRRVERARLLKSLVYEMWDGKPVYYVGYQEVLKGTKTVEQVMGSSILQSLLVSRLIFQLSSTLDMDIYAVAGNELGVQFKKGDWRSCDVAVFMLQQLEGEDWSKYAWVPPKIAIEVDTKADMGQFESSFEYYEKKTTNFLEFGVEKVIWLFTKSRKVWIAESGKDWIIRDWSQTVEVLPECEFIPDNLMNRTK
ncbi:hypothetical protein CWM47_30010 [Spirosoma pollinicola]|uniref:Uma2 family endonuclease n=2 Tax=Spirosoma pollinicola TaxID=2057025 RepID=A0A2K8Z735_9BACT|nr:hypothetical protein CWM47_30010 [Spirosoma pollinicola]